MSQAASICTVPGLARTLTRMAKILLSPSFAGVAVSGGYGVPVLVADKRCRKIGVRDCMALQIRTGFLPYILRILVSEYYTYCLGQVLGDRG